MNLCDTCHWSAHDREITLTTGEKHLYMCNNIGVPGWEYCEKKQEHPKECADYCLEGTYNPTGIWAGVSEVIKELQKIVESEGRKWVKSKMQK